MVLNELPCRLKTDLLYHPSPHTQKSSKLTLFRERLRSHVHHTPSTVIAFLLDLPYRRGIPVRLVDARLFTAAQYEVMTTRLTMVLEVFVSSFSGNGIILLRTRVSERW